MILEAAKRLACQASEGSDDRVSIKALAIALQAVIEHLQQKDEIYSDLIAKIEEQIAKEETG